MPFFLVGVQGTKRAKRAWSAYCAHVINFGGAGEPATTCHFGLHSMIAREAAVTSLRNWAQHCRHLDQQRRRDDTDEELRSGCKSFRTTLAPKGY
jgi:hypothetical protein